MQAFWSVLLVLMASAALRKQLAKQNIILSNSTFHILSDDTMYIVCGGFIENSSILIFFLEDTHEGLE